MTPIEMGTRMPMALALGPIVGCERQWHRRPAGPCTNALVAVGAAGFVLNNSSMNGEERPTRHWGPVASGDGLLGAG